MLPPARGSADRLVIAAGSAAKTFIAQGGASDGRRETHPPHPSAQAEVISGRRSLPPRVNAHLADHAPTWTPPPAPHFDERPSAGVAEKRPKICLRVATADRVATIEEEARALIRFSLALATSAAPLTARGGHETPAPFGRVFPVTTPLPGRPVHQSDSASSKAAAVFSTMNPALLLPNDPSATPAGGVGELSVSRQEHSDASRQHHHQLLLERAALVAESFRAILDHPHQWLDVENRESVPVMFRLRTALPDFYICRPSCGVLGPQRALPPTPLPETRDAPPTDVEVIAALPSVVTVCISILPAPNSTTPGSPSSHHHDAFAVDAAFVSDRRLGDMLRGAQIVVGVPISGASAASPTPSKTPQTAATTDVKAMHASLANYLRRRHQWSEGMFRGLKGERRTDLSLSRSLSPLPQAPCTFDCWLTMSHVVHDLWSESKRQNGPFKRYRFSSTASRRGSGVGGTLAHPPVSWDASQAGQEMVPSATPDRSATPTPAAPAPLEFATIPDPLAAGRVVNSPMRREHTEPPWTASDMTLSETTLEHGHDNAANNLLKAARFWLYDYKVVWRPLWWGVYLFLSFSIGALLGEWSEP